MATVAGGINSQPKLGVCSFVNVPSVGAKACAPSLTISLPAWSRVRVSRPSPQPSRNASRRTQRRGGVITTARTACVCLDCTHLQSSTPSAKSAWPTLEPRPLPPQHKTHCLLGCQPQVRRRKNTAHDVEPRQSKCWQQHKGVVSMLCLRQIPNYCSPFKYSVFSCVNLANTGAKAVAPSAPT